MSPWVLQTAYFHVSELLNLYRIPPFCFHAVSELQLSLEDIPLPNRVF